MENGEISNGQITASSVYDQNHAAFQGRLHYKPGNPVIAGAWHSGSPDYNQWLQVDLDNQHTKVTRVATQGRHPHGPNVGYRQWVTKYKLQYSNDSATFQYFVEQGQSGDKVR